MKYKSRNLLPAAVVRKLKSFPRFIYHNKLDAHIWEPDMQMRKLVSNALQMVSWSYIAFMQRMGYPLPDDAILDIFVHGSSTNYYYDDTSDIDIAIIANLDGMRAMFPNVDINGLMKSALGSWMRYHRIRVCGRGIDIDVLDVNTPRYGPGIYKVGSAYSLKSDSWIRRPELLKPDVVREIRKSAWKIFKDFRRQYNQMRKNNMGADFVDTFMTRITMERKDSYAKNYLQPVTPETMAFRMIRRCGMWRDLIELSARQRSRDFNISL